MQYRTAARVVSLFSWVLRGRMTRSYGDDQSVDVWSLLPQCAAFSGVSCGCVGTTLRSVCFPHADLHSVRACATMSAWSAFLYESQTKSHSIAHVQHTLTLSLSYKFDKQHHMIARAFGLKPHTGTHAQSNIGAHAYTRIRTEAPMYNTRSYCLSLNFGKKHHNISRAFCFKFF